MSLTAGLLMIGVAVVAPLALDRLPLRAPTGLRVVVPVGGLAAISLLLPQGPLAGAFALPWLVLAIGTAVMSLQPTARAIAAVREGALVERRLGPDTRAAGGLTPLTRAVAPLSAVGFWTVGAGWLVLNRLGVDPVGVGADLVLLTAVHFHFAGLAATTIVAASARSGPLGLIGLLGTLAAPVLVAIGFVAVPVLQVVGAMVFTGALLAWSVQAGPVPGGGVRGWLWWAARLAVWVSMPLAVWWAVGYVTGLPAPSIPVMAATHGVANAVAFALAGLLALPRGAHAPAPGSVGFWTVGRRR